MANPLLSLARSHVGFDGQVTMFLMPYATIQSNILRDAFVKVVPQYEWDYAHQVFFLFMGSVVDVQFAWKEDTPGQTRAIEVFWHLRTGDVKTDWMAFQLLPADILNELYQAYDQTRDVALANPNGASKDPEALTARGSE